MNKTKRGLQLSAAIVSIVFSSLLLCGSIVMLNTLAEYVATYGETNESIAAVRMIYIFVMLFAIATIIVSSIICLKPKQDMHKGLCITALVLNSILILLYIAGASWYLVFPLISAGLFIAELCVKNTPPAQIQSTQEQSSPISVSNGSQDKNSAEESIQETDVDERIKRIKALNEQGILSDEEMKNLIMEELKK